MSATGLVVLLVEDHVVHRDQWTKALTRDGFDVTAVGSCAEAIGCVSRMVFDVLVLDHDIIGGTGLMVLEYARRHGITTPALIVSGIATPEDAMSYGPFTPPAFLEKPCTPSQIATRIRELAAAAAAAAETGNTPSDVVLRRLRAIDPTQPNAVNRCRAVVYSAMADHRFDLLQFDALTTLSVRLRTHGDGDGVWHAISVVEGFDTIWESRDPRLRRVLDLIAITTETDTAKLAVALSMPRTVFLDLLSDPERDKRFWVRLARVRRAFRLVIAGEKLDYVAEETGFENADQLSRDVRVVLDATVTELRCITEQ